MITPHHLPAAPALRRWQAAKAELPDAEQRGIDENAAHDPADQDSSQIASDSFVAGTFATGPQPRTSGRTLR